MQKVCLESVDLLENVGIIESMRADSGRIFKLDEHIKRLYESAKTCGIDIDISKEQLKQNIKNILKASKLKEAFLRVTLRKDVKQPKLNIVVRGPKRYPSKFYKDGIKIITIATKKNLVNAQTPKVKSTDFLNGVLAVLEKYNNKEDANEMILLNHGGLPTEGTVANLFIVKDTVLVTPPTYLGVLEGITRNCVIGLAKKMKLTVSQAPFTRHELYNADEVFLTNTSMGIMPVTWVDSRKIKDGSPGEITKRLTKTLKILIKG